MSPRARMSAALNAAMEEAMSEGCMPAPKPVNVSSGEDAFIGNANAFLDDDELSAWAWAQHMAEQGVQAAHSLT